MFITLLQEALKDFENRLDVGVFLMLLLFLSCSAFSIALAQIGYFGALILWIMGMFTRRRFEFPRTPLDLFFLAYAVAEGLSTLFAYNKPQSLLYMQRRIVIIPIIYIILFHVRSRRTLKWLLGAMIFSAILVALWSFRDLATHFPEYLRLERRLSEFQIYMTAGGIMMIAVLMVLPFVIHTGTPPPIRWTAIALILPLGINLLFTFTRSSWLGFMAGALVIGVRRNWRIILPVVAIVALIVSFSSPEMKDRMASIYDPTHPSNISRLHMWHVGLMMFLDHPFIGIGDIGTEQLWDRYAQPDWPPEGHLHNNLIMWMATLGTLGFSVLVALFVRLWIYLANIEKHVRTDWLLGSLSLGGLAVLIGFHVNGLFEWNFGDTEIIMLIWTVVGLGFAVEKVAALEGQSG